MVKNYYKLEFTCFCINQDGSRNGLDSTKREKAPYFHFGPSTNNRKR